MMPFTIERYRGGRDREVADLVLSIQNDEAGIGLTLDDQPDLKDIVSVYSTGGFWIALVNERIVGCIGLLGYAGKGVLKKLFVAASYRGRHGPAEALLQTVLDRARELGFESIVLDTPGAARRSHSFYRKFGFVPVELKEFPPDYSYPDRNSLLLGRHVQTRKTPAKIGRNGLATEHRSSGSVGSNARKADEGI